jgi:hypothetical protein
MTGVAGGVLFSIFTGRGGRGIASLERLRPALRQVNG